MSSVRGGKKDDESLYLKKEGFGYDYTLATHEANTNYSTDQHEFYEISPQLNHTSD